MVLIREAEGRRYLHMRYSQHGAVTDRARGLSGGSVGPWRNAPLQGGTAGAH